MQIEFREGGNLLGILEVEQIEQGDPLSEPREMGKREEPTDLYIWGFTPVSFAWKVQLKDQSGKLNVPLGTGHDQLLPALLEQCLKPLPKGPQQH